MPRFRFKYKGIICDTYEPEEKTTEEAALLLYGFPATIGENSATALLKSCGYLVFQPHYPGTYDSDGTFTPHTAVEMVSTLVEGLASGEVYNVKKDAMQNVPPMITACIGYSFGCIIALRAIPHLINLRSLLLVSPAISYGKAQIPSGFKEDGPTFLAYIRRSRPFTYRFGEDEAWLDLYEGRLNQPTNNPPDTLHSVLGVVGTSDSSFELDVLQHNFSSIVRQYVGLQPKVKLMKVEGGGHSVSTLVTNKTISEIKSNLF